MAVGVCAFVTEAELAVTYNLWHLAFCKFYDLSLSLWLLLASTVIFYKVNRVGQKLQNTLLLRKQLKEWKSGL